MKKSDSKFKEILKLVDLLSPEDNEKLVENIVSIIAEEKAKLAGAAIMKAMKGGSWVI